MPNSSLAIFNLGIVNKRLGNFKQALENFQQYEKINSDARIWSQIADVKKMLGENDVAIQSYDKSLLIDSSYFPSLINKGVLLTQMKKYTEAIDLFDRALQIRPESADTLFNKSIACLTLEKYYDALYSIEEALAINPNKIKFLRLKSDIEYSMDSFTEALVTTDRLLKLEPSSEIYLNNKGLVLSKLNRENEALVCLDEAIKIKPDYLFPLRTKMTILEKLGRREEAISVVNTILKIEEDAHMLYHKGMNLYELNRLEEALEIFDRSLQLDHNQPHVLTRIIRILKKLNRQEEIESKIKKLIEQINYENPSDSEVLLLLDFGHLELALNLYNKILTLNPQNANAWYNKACTLSKMKKIDEAIDALLISTVLDLKYKKLQENDNDFENIRTAPRYRSNFTGKIT